LRYKTDIKRWDWTWEEPRSTALSEQEPDPHTPPAGGANAPPTPPDPPVGPVASVALRRRRAALALGIAVVAIVAVLLLTLALSGGGSSHGSSLAQHPGARRAAAVRLTPAEEAALVNKQEDGAIDRVLSYTPAITEGGSKGHEVALTFDDGPGPYTEQLVAELNRLHAHATFFAIGEEERYFSGGTRLELRSGDAIGDHTETHPMMATLSRHDQHEELLEQIARIELLGGPRPRLFRPPYGSFDATTFKELHAMRLLMVLWSTDTADYTLPGVQAIVQRALAGAHPGAIILMHDAGGNRQETIAALPAIITGLRRRGLHPVTVPQMMLDDPPPRGRPIPTSLAGD
jgi:peptidoglycan/xylan/chitin deacetylase (PgdA/CDA1 family)